MHIAAGYIGHVAFVSNVGDLLLCRCFHCIPRYIHCIGMRCIDKEVNPMLFEKCMEAVFIKRRIVDQKLPAARFALL